MNQKVFTPKAPAAIGPYSQAVLAGNMLFCSGMIPVDPETNALVENDIKVQSKQIMSNIDNLLKEAGYSVDDVVKTTCFLADIKDFAAFNEIYGEYFTSKPARSCVAAKDLPKGALVEVEVIAVK
ncbi:MAG: RidA family protein [Erysipelotrichaceae bacterium]|nr:RidA family protein [Erysipelotrichaceae bacterium]